MLMLQNFNSVNQAPQGHAITNKSEESIVSIHDSDASLLLPEKTASFILPEKTKTRGRPKTMPQKNFQKFPKKSKFQNCTIQILEESNRSKFYSENISFNVIIF